MKRIALATLLALGTTLAAAQEVPPPNCGETPEYPGRLGTDLQKRTFDKKYKEYDKCIRGYVAERQAAMKANEAAAGKAVDDFNALVLKMRADSGENVDKDGKGSTAPKMDTGGKQGARN